jgi:RTX calcium-binding nonapeptide repeat (4 copies)
MAPLGSGRVLMRRALVPAAAAATALVLAAAPALATVSASTDGVDTVEITGDSDPDVITMSCVGGQAYVEGPGALDLGCGDVAIIRVDAGEDEDAVNLGGVTQSAFSTLDHTSVEVSDSSLDSVVGSDARDLVSADDQDDVEARAGDDLVEGAGTADGGPGDDTLVAISHAVHGGDGDDRIVTPGEGPVDGGPGHDTVVLDDSGSAAHRVALVISDVSVGPAAGLGAATSGIEEYDITTTAGAEADAVDSTRFSGLVDVRTGDGADTVTGGPGWDVVDSGRGNDTVVPGGGADVVRAGDGDDVIQVRDGVADVVDCGAGTDSVVADRQDALAGCENVALPAPETYPVLGTKKVHRGPRARFTFGSPIGGATFECQLDGGSFVPCTSPYAIRTKRLAKGRHTLAVRAVQPAGNADPTPSTFTFRVLRKQHRAAQA